MRVFSFYCLVCKICWGNDFQYLIIHSFVIQSFVELFHDDAPDTQSLNHMEGNHLLERLSHKTIYVRKFEWISTKSSASSADFRKGEYVSNGYPIQIEASSWWYVELGIGPVCIRESKKFPLQVKWKKIAGPFPKKRHKCLNLLKMSMNVKCSLSFTLLPLWTIHVEFNWVLSETIWNLQHFARLFRPSLALKMTNKMKWIYKLKRSNSKFSISRSSKRP